MDRPFVKAKLAHQVWSFSFFLLTCGMWRALYWVHG
jgi:hypothetical protein